MSKPAGTSGPSRSLPSAAFLLAILGACAPLGQGGGAQAPSARAAGAASAEPTFWGYSAQATPQPAGPTFWGYSAHATRLTEAAFWGYSPAATPRAEGPTFWGYAAPAPSREPASPIAAKR